MKTERADRVAQLVVEGRVTLRAEPQGPALPNGYEVYEGRVRKVVNGDRVGWWRFNDHYDRDGYCDNPARGY